MENTSVVSKVLLLLVHLLKLCILTSCLYQHLWALDMHLSTSEVLSFHHNEHSPNPNPDPQQLEYVFFSFILNCSTKSWQSGNKENNQPKWHASNLFSFLWRKCLCLFLYIGMELRTIYDLISLCTASILFFVVSLASSIYGALGGLVC